jgi:hypothetical protein
MLDPDAFPHLVEKLWGLFWESIHPRKFRWAKFMRQKRQDPETSPSLHLRIYI